MFHHALTEVFNNLPTPFFYYDLDLLNQTLKQINQYALKQGYHVHYALKANSNDKILEVIRKAGLGADCVSGNEVKKALDAGFKAQDIAFAGVGKTDPEITFALEKDIFCFNCESVQEIEVINELAGTLRKKAGIALRINPNVDANTHKYITTGLEENKFGINTWELEDLITKLSSMEYIDVKGLHFHIGSQITDLSSYKALCLRVNELQTFFEQHHIKLEHINVGGGLGINYKDPESQLIPDFKTYFDIFRQNLELRKGQQLHFELGRSIVGQCGTLVSRVLYIKNGLKTNFAIIDAGFTELIRPALYQAKHKIQVLTEKQGKVKYDVVGPICESSDCFEKGLELPELHRGDLVAIRSAGAYGEVMTSSYNLRDKAKVYYSDEVYLMSPTLADKA
jgi:diaminopimelate decarboxylase